EFVASKYVQRHGISIACLRPPVVFGHGRKRGAVLWPEHFASYPPVGNAVEGLAYNGGGETVGAEQIAAIVCRFLPDADIRFEPDKPRTPLVDNTDGSRLGQVIDFRLPPLADVARLH